MQGLAGLQGYMGYSRLQGLQMILSKETKDAFLWWV